jgi:hypothetical protein
LITSSAKTWEFDFTLIADDPRGVDAFNCDHVADALFDAGCDDATPGIRNGVWVIDFDREARNFSHAVASAIRDVASVGLKVLRVEPDTYVNAAEIAERLNVSREAVRKWFHSRPDTRPPAPAIGASGASPLYDWPRFLRWLRQRHPERVPTSLIVQNRVIARFNARLGA